MSDAAPRRAPASSWARRLARIALATLACLGLVELTVRIATGSLLTWASPDDRERYGIVDPVVGRLLRPGLSARLPGGATVRTGEHGIRLNGAAAPPAGGALTLVGGDSFAFGDEVEDHESWPAVLEGLTGHRVVNAGVPGFGLDQAVLRVSALAGHYAPRTIVVSFIPHDVVRCEMSFWSGHAKPYFELVPSGLRLHRAPEPAPALSPVLTGLLSRSVAIERFFGRSLHWDGPDTVVHHQGREVACLLMEQLAALGREHGASVVLVAQPQRATSAAEERELAAGVGACAERNGLRFLDLFPLLDRLAPAERERLFRRHMTPEGNRFVAGELAAFLAAGASSPRGEAR